MPRKRIDLAETLENHPGLEESLKNGLPMSFLCVERRHQRAAEFMTWNAMHAVARAHRKESDGKLICKAGAYWLANANNRSVNSEREAIKNLEKAGWIKLVHKKIGGTNWYQVLEHDEFVAAHPGSCPKLRYTDVLISDYLGVPKHTPLGREIAAMPSAFLDGKIKKLVKNDSLSQAIIEWARGLSDSERERIREHWKQKGNAR